MNEKWRGRVAGAAAGLANGLFGGGGGMVFIPVMSRSSLKKQTLYATCVAVIFPICAVSAAVYFLRAELFLKTALPYLLGGLAGGSLGGQLYGKISAKWLKRLFAVFLFYGAVRYLL